MIDHLFRHQYGKMVSILTRIFGLEHLETIEDAVQDTFANAVMRWRDQIPDNPEGWLTQAAKNRAIDLLRKIKADHNRTTKFEQPPSTLQIDELFLEDEIADSQLRMIFTACHPVLDPKDQIAFALKTVAGFGTHEIAASLLLKKETVKKRLSRARKVIKEKEIAFSIPTGAGLQVRLDQVHRILYLIFNEGFHSGQKELLIRKDLCGEALRLIQLILKKPQLRSGGGYALFGLMCFHASRLESKVSDEMEIIDLRNQDRTKWYFPLVRMGNMAMKTALNYHERTIYHYEAAIAEIHLRAGSFAETNWEQILSYYLQMNKLYPSTLNLLNIAVVLLELGRLEEVGEWLEMVRPQDLEQRVYLYHGTYAEYYIASGKLDKARECLDLAIAEVSNQAELEYLQNKRNKLGDR